ncbi:hypothetical protein PTSG_02953 [Salpingoeca rosetta]|uniref:Uncharacterized protein n=1 Tax=Salpingoeca rosetta (strain ATCC 50818 / BSB-021) TaxID=946362 RepID=F2U3U0_SALR5|nr:uncharacterized protein PTSG_02953 [Salpingoeca rosetta]EGD82284.1 hypothetical protein PTSG_02953 [Salpingoeca rosetta]|eukprot:XP_004996467.1 hypothetical protein PTSG_02953 [Salpingoeca rosetta]
MDLTEKLQKRKLQRHHGDAEAREIQAAQSQPPDEEEYWKTHGHVPDSVEELLDHIHASATTNCLLTCFQTQSQLILEAFQSIVKADKAQWQDLVDQHNKATLDGGDADDAICWPFVESAKDYHWAYRRGRFWIEQAGSEGPLLIWEADNEEVAQDPEPLLKDVASRGDGSRYPTHFKFKIKR